MADNERLYSPFFKVSQPKLPVQEPKMQTIFHYRKHNRDKIKQNDFKNSLETDYLIVENDGLHVSNVLSLEIVEPVTNQPTSFSLFDLSVDPKSLEENLKQVLIDKNFLEAHIEIQPNELEESLENHHVAIENQGEVFEDHESVFGDHDLEIVLEDQDEDTSYQRERLSSLSILELAQNMLNDILLTQQKHAGKNIINDEE